MSDSQAPEGSVERRMSSRALATAGALVALTLVGAGAVVNAAQAALSVPDWPLSYGKLLLTDWPGNVAYEQTHRLLAVLTLVLAILCVLQVRREPDATSLSARLPRHLLGLLVLQVLLGGAVVLFLDPHWLGALHLVAGVAVAAGFLVNAMAPTWQRAAQADAGNAAGALGRTRRGNRRLLVLAGLQILLGALSRHPVAGQGQFIGTMLAHVLLGLVVSLWIAVHGIVLARRSPTPGLRWVGAALAALAALQLAVGLWVFIISPEPLSPPEIADPAFVMAHTLHVVAGTVLLGLLLVAALALRSQSGAGGGGAK